MVNIDPDRAGEPLRALVEVPEPRTAAERRATRAEILTALEH